ncbi:conserved hypothetical protein [Ricinus communis]|uniref:Uncharacterized protein n=1 Tax=Ricinus communis TaxID=3988 RepID=B9R8Y2_RICCO|nr:conserved hypothetical protein [Ricinus communis]
MDPVVSNSKINTLMIPYQRCWDADLMRDIFNARDVSIILGTTPSSRSCVDSWFWMWDISGLASRGDHNELASGNVCQA